jgi:hypothetical protein
MTNDQNIYRGCAVSQHKPCSTGYANPSHHLLRFPDVYPLGFSIYPTAV